jgi:ribonuclease HI
VAIFVGKELAVQLKFKLDNKCSNNQAEQPAILKTLELIETIEITENSPPTATIFTGSRISIDSLTFRHRASCILGQAFHSSTENVFYIFNQQIYFII